MQLGGGETLIASRKGAWIQHPQAAALELRGSMPSALPGTLDTTRQLLEGAIAAAERRATTAKLWPLTVRRWALDLVDQWYTAHHSVGLLPIAIERYESMDRPELANFARGKLEEEGGHDRFPLNDLAALGYDAKAAADELAPGWTARSLVDYARKCVHGPRPIGFFGYIFALERRIVRITAEALQEIDQALPRGAEAASGVRAHVMEFDHKHVEELVRFVDGLPGDDRSEIALACHETAAIFAAAPARTGNDREREQQLSRLRVPAYRQKTGDLQGGNDDVRPRTDQGLAAPPAGGSESAG